MNVLTALAIPTALAMIHHEVPAYLERAPLIKAVEPESPAEKAGIQPGDLIVKIDGQENPAWRDIEDTVAVNPDQSVPITINRGGESRQFTLQVRPAFDPSDRLCASN